MSDEKVQQHQEQLLVHPPVRGEELEAVDDGVGSEQRRRCGIAVGGVEQCSISPELRNLSAVPVAVTNTVSGVGEGVLVTLGVLAPERRDLGRWDDRSNRINPF